MLECESQKQFQSRCFPVFLAGDIRNDVYVTLERGEFEKGNKTDGEAAFSGSLH